MDKQELEHLIKIIPEKINSKSASLLSARSDWNLESCKYFTSRLTTEIVLNLKRYGTQNFGIIYMPDLAAMGVTRTAPMGSKRWKKNLERIVKETGEYTIDDEYKDVTHNFISYLGTSIVAYYLQGQKNLLNALADPKHFVESLDLCINLLLNINEDIEEGEVIWDPYKVQDVILQTIFTKNKEIINSEEENDQLGIIPKRFNILKDTAKLSPLKINIDSKHIKDVDISEYQKPITKEVDEFQEKAEELINENADKDLSTDDKFKRLEKITDMFEKGLLDKEEFENLKKDIL
jgi:hypothetical protein